MTSGARAPKGYLLILQKMLRPGKEAGPVSAQPGQGVGGQAPAPTQASLAPLAAHSARARWGMGGQPLEVSASPGFLFRERGAGGGGVGHASSRDTGFI